MCFNLQKQLVLRLDFELEFMAVKTTFKNLNFFMPLNHSQFNLCGYIYFENEVLHRLMLHASLIDIQ
jgi:hypothetical protein